MISTEVRQEVVSRLRAAEAEHHAKVLLAIESGSRAWGFASPNSPAYRRRVLGWIR